MNPNIKLILKKFGHHFDDHDTKWEHRFMDLERDRVPETLP